MTFLGLSPMLRTRDLRATVDFWCEVLGFRCEAFEDEWGWAAVVRDRARVMFGTPNAHEPYEIESFTGSFYFRVDDVDALWERLRETTRVCYPVEDFEYGMREFAVYDNNGYLLQFGTEIPPK